MNEEANFPYTILAKRIGSQKKIDIFGGKEYSAFKIEIQEAQERLDD